MRLVYDNLADRGSVTCSNSMSQSLGAGNLQSDIKSNVWRSSSATSILTCQIPVGFVRLVALCMCNFSATAYARVVLNRAGTQIYDSGQILANPPSTFGSMDWGTEPLGVNHYSLAENHKYFYHWLPEGLSADEVVVSVSDPDNQRGYLEASRLVIGDCIVTPPADVGVRLSNDDLGTLRRTEAGDFSVVRGPVSRKLKFSLGFLTPYEAQKVRKALLSAGKTKSLFVSLYPENESPEKEQAFQIVGKLTSETFINLSFFNSADTNLEISEL